MSHQHNTVTSADIRPHSSLKENKDFTDEFAALNAIAGSLEARAIETIDWYLVRKRWPRQLSRMLRSAAILFCAAGGVIPLLNNVDLSGDLWGVKWSLPSSARWGYILFALAASSILTDRYFGFSSSWMRYMKAQMSLQRALERFQLSWGIWQIHSKDNFSTKDKQHAAIALLESFSSQIGELVDEEFNIWTTQFKEQLAELQTAINKKNTENRPGNIVVHYHSDTAINGKADIYLDNILTKQVDSRSILLTATTPGNHFIQVKANSGELSGSASVSLEAGQTIEIGINLVPINFN